MNANLLHDLIFYVMYASIVIALVIIIERALYFTYTRRQAQQLAEALSSTATPDVGGCRKSLALTIARPILTQRAQGADRDTLNDVMEAQYLLSKPCMTRSLWILETIVTAAPLLGLLGTIMGIIDTFKALATSGVSDPGQVSASMGTALYATGLGIAIALLCLVGNNFLQSRMERISELLKVVMIKAGSAVVGTAPSRAQATSVVGLQRA